MPRSPNPRVPAAGASRNYFVDAGPGDKGATFDYHVGTIGPGESATFAIYYGAAPDEATARDNLTVGRPGR